MKSLQWIASLFLLCSIYSKTKGNSTTVLVQDVQRGNEVRVPLVVKSTFHLHLQGNVFEDTCAIIPYRPDTLYSCNYNTSSPVVIIIHGWTLNGKMENWVIQMASALKTRLEHVNVLICDWRDLALKPYLTATKNARQVGWDVAKLLKWLEKTTRLSMEKVHLIGFSLGAHVAGFAGRHFKGSKKLGRITGLDPAGPQFEGAPAFDRLSPSDAKFVDAIHTFSKSTIGFAVGIKQPVGHVDFYPNGGFFQPGCQITDMYSNLYQYGLEGVPKTIKCSHQRAVHLFTDSLLHPEQQTTAYMCRDDAAFDRGLCMDCSRNRCNTMGYGASNSNTKGSSKGFYVKTRAQMPFKVHHYQLRIQLLNLIQPVKASLSVAIIGTEGNSSYIPITLFLEHAGNKTYSALVTVNTSVGKLQALRLHLKEEQSFSSWWRRVSTIMGTSGGGQDSELSVGKIGLKHGESQEKTWFCGPAGEITELLPAQEQEFINCQVISRRRRRFSSRRHTRHKRPEEEN